MSLNWEMSTTRIRETVTSLKLGIPCRHSDTDGNTSIRLRELVNDLRKKQVGNMKNTELI